METDTKSNPVQAPVERFELCVVGLGIAGLNALVAAMDYLPRGTRVVVIDRNAGPGGMWHDVYDFVKLHQPYRMFTAGDTPWSLQAPAGHLADRGEVLVHMADCLARVRAYFDVIAYLGCACSDIVEVFPARVRVEGHNVTSQAPLRIIAKRVIDARGFDVQPARAMALSCETVVSTTPERLRQIPGDAPIYIVGAGKTGMDVAAHVIRNQPERKVTVIAGQGVVFLNRDVFFPEGWRRLFGGRQSLRAFGEIVARFDGDNEDAVFEVFKQAYTIGPDPKGQRCYLGLMSQAEAKEIAQGVQRFRHGYLRDVVEAETGPRAVMRDGTEFAVEPGAVFVYCTASLLRGATDPRPVLSPKGAVLTIGLRFGTHFLSSIGTFFLAHLYFTKKLRRSRILFADLEGLRGGAPRLWLMAALTLSYANSIVIANSLPMRTLRKCGMDVDRWHILPRRLLALAWMGYRRKRAVAHCNQVLRRVQARTGVKSGRLYNNAARRRAALQDQT